ncbi:hypothetical protein [Algoriphagus antarcticus]|uniref:Uncharacterized protein n=1 Tax=Algoriphagus antarcticus TaxID=238540 RepID=A0A3E0DXA8_9BACT|nr:hypothetical protein [Algoriphagus antarcticus]REG90585.1 hypothetical protein C8N25_10683 [Algoriphagus antarcticus]
MKEFKFFAINLYLIIGLVEFSFSQKLVLKISGDSSSIEIDEELTMMNDYSGDAPHMFDRFGNLVTLKKTIITVPENWSELDLTFKIKENYEKDEKEKTPVINDKNEISFSQLADNVSSVSLLISNTMGTISNGDFKFKLKSEEVTLNFESKEFSPFPFPIFSYTFEKTDINKNHRILLIDGTPRPYSNRGFSLKKFETFDNDSINLKHSKALVSGRSLSVFTKNISLLNLEYIRIAVNGINYTYNAGITYLFDGTFALDSEEEIKKTAKTTALSKTEQETKNKINQDYFALVLEDLKKINELTIEDYQTLQQYQSILLDSAKRKRLDVISLNMVSQIVSFTPNYLNITSFPLTIPNSDEVEISTEVKYKGGLPNSVSSGTFKTTGALSVNVGSAIYFTGLKNNDIYTEPLKVDNQPDELRAVIDEDDQLSVGVGINSEITYRTGSIFRPSVSIGFFIPFEEQITPFFAIGPGISIIDSKVSLSLSYGFAFGKINSIKEKYRDIDLTNLGSSLSNTDLIQGVWSRSWYLGIGVGFNMNSEK